jgi:hypothetical protein
VTRVIVKVQVSVTGNEGSRVLIYTYGFAQSWEGEASAQILELMRGRKTAFLWAEVGPHDTLGLTSEEAPWQAW